MKRRISSINIFLVSLTFFFLTASSLPPDIAHASTVNSSVPSSAPGLTNTDLTNGLVGYWPFDGKYMTWSSATVGTSTDASGNGNNGTLVNMNRATSVVPGKIGQGLKFNGTTGYVDAGNGSSLNINGPMSISVWFKPAPFIDPANDASPMIVFKGDWAAASTISYYFGFSLDGAYPGYLSFIAIDSSGNYIGREYSGALKLNVWYHLVAVSDGRNRSSIKIYVNGVRVDDTNLSGSVSSITNINQITNHVTLGAAFVDGLICNYGYACSPSSIDDVRIYNRALSPAEVSTLYHLGLATVNKTIASSTVPGLTNTDLSTASSSPGSGGNVKGLEAYYPFDGKFMNWTDATDGTALDATGNTANNATLENMNRGTNTVAGKSGQALSFDGQTSYAQGPTGIIGTGTTSVCAWIKQTDFGLTGGGSGTANAIVANTQFIFYTSSTNNNLALTSNASTPATSATNAIVNGVWEFVCGTRSTADANGVASTSLYVNGVISAAPSGATVQNSGTPASSSSHTNVGTKGNAIADYFYGTIDDVRIYNRLLSATEIAQLYSATRGNVVNKSDTGLTNTDFIGTTTIPGGTSISSGLVGYWPFDGKYMTWSSATVGTSTDASGNGNNGTLVNMNRATSVVPGKIGQGLKFDSSDEVFIHAKSLGYTNLTASVWFRHDNSDNCSQAFSNVFEGLVSKNLSNDFVLAYVCQSLYGFNSGTVIAYAQGAGGNSGDITTTMLNNDNKWHMGTLTCNGTVCKVYVDGRYQSQGNLSGNVFDSVAPTDIGAYSYTDESVKGLYQFNGSLDDIRIYNRALSATEVKQLYTMGR